MTAETAPHAAGLAGLVPLAELLAILAGDRGKALETASLILTEGRAALPPSHDDLLLAVDSELHETGVLKGDRVDAARAAELVAVCEILASVSPLASASPPDPRLVLSAPGSAIDLEDRERLESFVLDVIRQSRSSLVIGGAFWNDVGFEIIEEVLRPAIEVRGVMTTVYANLPEGPRASALCRRLEQFEALGRVTVKWFAGRAPTMLHAKFVLTPISTQGIRHNIEGVGRIRRTRSAASCRPTRG